MDIKKEYERWLENATADANVAAELKTLDNAKIEDKNQINFANSSCVRWLCQQSPEASHNQWTRIRS
jgi:hypothetical protein